ncbi:MAG: phosphoesterase [Candidatus Diapherotrites archaeon CG11_big_fil_rev_8_21_14_0_20_37_9]|nr:MAG: phosphoesterase [Candidatus Diapherotrites archaeon CG11_big_fil_rev_8_21_14_0_20_37_9]
MSIEKKTEISSGIEIIDLAIWIPKEKLLAITDLQLGAEELLNNEGFFVPRTNFDEIKKIIEKIFEKTGKTKTAIINGDLKHEFGKISEQEWREAVQIIELLKKNSEKVILVKGNHDSIIGPVAQSRGVEVIDEFLSESKVLFVHGHKEPEKESVKNAKTIIIGHEHPCVSIRDGIKSEKYKCFLKGKYQKKTLIVMPSMNQLSLGSDVTKEQTMSPLINKAGEFEVFAVEDEIYYMGKVKEL